MSHESDRVRFWNLLSDEEKAFFIEASKILGTKLHKVEFHDKREEKGPGPDVPGND